MYVAITIFWVVLWIIALLIVALSDIKIDDRWAGVMTCSLIFFFLWSIQMAIISTVLG
jgi:hypothetical protein